MGFRTFRHRVVEGFFLPRLALPFPGLQVPPLTIPRTRKNYAMFSATGAGGFRLLLF
jgi:hypothetical protein